MDKCIKLQPNDGKYWSQYGYGLFHFGLYYQAIEKFKKCQQIKYQDKGLWEFKLAYVYYHMNILNDTNIL